MSHAKKDLLSLCTLFLSEKQWEEMLNHLPKDCSGRFAERPMGGEATKSLLSMFLNTKIYLPSELRQ